MYRSNSYNLTNTASPGSSSLEAIVYVSLALEKFTQAPVSGMCNYQRQSLYEAFSQYSEKL